MGGARILVIGDDWHNQLHRYQSMEYADAMSPHIVQIDRLEEARQRYRTATTATFHLRDGSEIKDFRSLTPEMGSVPLTIVHRPLNGAEPFPEWASKEYGARMLAAGAEPDPCRDHPWGWMRLDESGEVTELVERTIPGSFFFFFRWTCADLLLKPGAKGWDIDGGGVVTEVVEGYAGSARLSDIDFPAMRRAKVKEAADRWDAVRSAAETTWVPLVDIRKKYPLRTDTYDEAVEQAASREWFDQPALRKAFQARATNNYTADAIDPMLLPREDYVQRCTGRGCVLLASDVIMRGQHWRSPDEAELLAGLDPDALLTFVAVKC